MPAYRIGGWVRRWRFTVGLRVIDVLCHREQGSVSALRWRQINESCCCTAIAKAIRRISGAGEIMCR